MTTSVLAPSGTTCYKSERQPRRTPARTRTVNPLNENEAAQTWSARLGSLAAESPASQLDTAYPNLSPRLSAVLQHLRQRHQRQQDAADKLRANEFILGA